MKAHGTFLLTLLTGLLASSTGCSEKETPAPVVVAQTSKPESPKPDPKPEKHNFARAGEPNRVAAEWVLGIGGKVRILIDGEKREIKALSDLPQAEFAIDVVDTQSKPINEADLAKLDGLSRLKALWIRDVPMTGSGLAHVHGLAELEVLGLERTNTADESLQYLKDMPNLLNLHLDRTPITDVGLAHLAATKLTILRLGGTKVTDVGLEHLKKVRSLRSISLNGTMVTDAGVADFKKAVPGCEVLR